MISGIALVLVLYIIIGFVIWISVYLLVAVAEEKNVFDYVKLAAAGMVYLLL
jgi:hypothetical protein